MVELDIERKVWCPNPDFGGTQDVGDCQTCDFFGEVSYNGETMTCNYKKKAEAQH